MKNLEMPPIIVATQGGKIVDLTKLQPSQIDIENVFKVTAKKGRYGDNSDRKIPLAVHLLLTAELARNDTENFTGKERLMLEFISLLHDTAEAFIGDIVTGVKHSFFMQNVNILEDHILKVIFESQGFDFGFNFDTLMSRIKKYDRQALSIEVPYAFDYIDPRWYSDKWIDEITDSTGGRIMLHYLSLSEDQLVDALMTRLENLKWKIK